MRSPIQLTQIVLNDPTFDSLEPLDEATANFERFRVELTTSRYRGFPNVWTFAILRQLDRRSATRNPDEVLGEARDLLSRVMTSQNRKQPQPLLLISDDPNILVTRLSFDDELVFFIDSRSLPDRMPREVGKFRYSLLMSAVRAKLDSQQLSRLLLVPYQPNDPAVGWRFFGRHRELDRLINAPTNFFVVGPRRIGKTSLLRETKRQLDQRGRKVYMIPCQYLEDPGQVLNEIMRQLDVRTVTQAVRRNQALDEALLPAVLKSVIRRDRQVVLILDELGNAIHKHGQDPWRFIGALREFSQTGNLRVIMSGWQEIFRHQGEFESPFINFAEILTLRGFTDSEIQECLVDPLSLWGDVRAKRFLLRRVTTDIGRHPHLLQYFGDALFTRLVSGKADGDVDSLVSQLLEDNIVEVFQPAVDEVFFRSMRNLRLHRYLFLRRCFEAEKRREPLYAAELTDQWIRDVLDELGLATTFDDRRRAMLELELRGLTDPIGGHQIRHRIAAPVIYQAIKRAYKPVEQLIEMFADELLADDRPDHESKY